MGAHSAIASRPRTPERTQRADHSARGGPLRRTAKSNSGWPPMVSCGLLVALIGVAVWLAVDPQTPDLAAQVYRANLFGEVGWTVWDARWYGGHDVPGYSLVFPPLASLLGVRTVGALAVLASTALFERIARFEYGRRAARWGAVWFALAALGDVWSGRITFALGVSFALAAVAALVGAGSRHRRGMTLLAVALAAVCAACSPVAGALLALAGVTYSAFTRSARSALVLGAPVALMIAALVGGFAEGGWEPYPFLSFIATLAVLGGFLLALGRGEGLLRAGALAYLAACIACVAIHTPMGANVERYGVLLAGPLLLCATLARPRKRTAVAVAALLGIALWTAWGPVRETVAVAGNASTSAAYYVPVERFVADHGGSLVRVEVPFTRGHWEAAWLARRVSLARGWEKQLDERYDGVLLAKGLTAAAYYRWLRANAVSYVALPDTPLDPSSAQEGRLIESGLGYLREVQRTPHWRIYAVLGARALAVGPGALSAVGRDWFLLHARLPGTFVVRVHYTRYWVVQHGSACLASAPGGWTEVRVREPGAVRVAARFSLARALGLSSAGCAPRA